MNGFEFLLTLFGLLLGLALAEGLGGLANALNSQQRVRIGWPTALLGLFVSCDLVTFWMYGWAMREVLPVTWPTMFGGFAVTSLYFIAASLVFPKHDEDWLDLDAHFERHRRTVIGGMFIANIALIGTFLALVGFPDAGSLRAVMLTWSFFPVALTAMFAPQRWLVLGALIWLIALYPLSIIWS